MHWYDNRTKKRKFDPETDRRFCLDRVIVLPYPSHATLMPECGQPPQYSPWNARRINVSFYGTIREKRGPQGGRVSDSSGGVRLALVKLARAHGGNEALRRRGLDVRLFHSSEFDPNRRCGPGLAVRCRPIVGSGGKLQGREYAAAMRDSIFCLLLRGDTSTSRRLSDSVAAGCIPIIISDYIGPNMPFAMAEGHFPLLPPHVPYDEWSLRIREADFIADPMAAIDAVLSRFLLRAGGRTEPPVAQMMDAMRRDANSLLFCRGKPRAPRGERARPSMADLVLGEAFARLRSCDSCNGARPPPPPPTWPLAPTRHSPLSKAP